ncbi:squamosa promoter-binding-like protein 15 [Asparagus officinalis]|uniref:squamosa promoter-binding-like protein 15 n=1 Tax=Asparagus officinalis TaxID=4686 RepID=UPI00098DE478|nr:squamosa promoter-binding-like protein 15 [Asparagus officinalis]
MEGEISTQIAPPIVMQQSLPSLFRESPPVHRKRDVACQNANLLPTSTANWNPNLFSWDSVSFSVRQSSNEVQISQDSIMKKSFEEGGENLSLKLGGGGALVVKEDQAAVRPSKKVRSGSPGNTGGGNYPMCQVDDCKTDLSSAKDYHRRHKVCEVHSKMTKALVGNQMQRFCQQCSRFHLLSEFDEGKRSCRRRLAGHNRRRRKTHPEEASTQLSHVNQGSSDTNNLDIVKLLTIFARMQGNGAGGAKVAGAHQIPDKDQVNHILGRIHSLRAANSASRSAVPGGFDLNISQVPDQSSFEDPSKLNGNTSTTDLLTVLSSALGASCPDNFAAMSQASSGNKDPVEKARQSLPLQLFSSVEDGTLPKLGSTRKYVSSECSNLIDGRSPSSSPPVAQRLFPLHSESGSMQHESMSICPGNSPVEAITSRRHIVPLDLFKESERLDDSGALQSPPFQAGYTSSSGSDRSPSSSNSDGQDRTGRIIFKLFDKDPSSFPGALRAQILSWLSNSPSEMESYIRPGCVVLSIYASMPSTAWHEIESNLCQRVSSLVQCSESEFWRSGRFLVRTNRQLASHKDGKIHLCKSWKTWRAPELTYVSPIAVVSGQETSFVLKGWNLTAPGTRIHCTYMGGYTSKEVLGSVYQDTIYKGSSTECFSFHCESGDVFGRCFIEVENGLKGNSFPVIIADATVCKELRLLESDFDAERTTDSISHDQVGPRSREDVLHFLNELGWLFQRKNTPLDLFLTNFSPKRFNFLLTFSVERDWPAVVKTLLDMLVERSLVSQDSLVQESLEMLLEIQLLNRAVKRKCRKMVDLLLHYSVKGSDNDTKMYLFRPNSAGPGGITPLHLAASMQDSEDMVNALTDDPQEIGLNCWDSILDESGQSPYMYASARNKHSYNELVARKLADKKSGQISISLEDHHLSFRITTMRSCAQCARLDAHRFKRRHRNGGFLHRPYIHSMLAIATVCVCVCLLMRGLPKLDNIAPFMWENLEYGPQ